MNAENREEGGGGGEGSNSTEKDKGHRDRLGFFWTNHEKANSVSIYFPRHSNYKNTNNNEYLLCIEHQDLEVRYHC